MNGFVLAAVAAFLFGLSTPASKLLLESFEPFFNKGSLLELGSFKGDFTEKFLPYFDDITCVEASEVAIQTAKNKLGDKVKFVNSLFETAALPKRYDNIVMTHVLEHLNNQLQCSMVSDDGQY